MESVVAVVRAGHYEGNGEGLEVWDGEVVLWPFGGLAARRMPQAGL